jgi:hypothetical protein
MYACDCCERLNVPAKLKGIGYVCDDCLAAYCWTGYESGPAPEPHYPVCPFKQMPDDAPVGG